MQNLWTLILERKPFVLKVLAMLSWVVGIASLGWQIYLWFLYLSICPQKPQPTTGHIYPLQVHEQIVYLTKAQAHRVDGPWVYITFGSIAIFIIIATKLKSLNRK